MYRNHRLKRRNRAQGFTLLEVLIALAVLAIALTAVTRAASQNASISAHLRDKTFAHWVALNKATEVHASGLWPDKGRSNGSVELADRKWFWNMVIENTPDATVKKMEIEVRLIEEDENPVTHLIGYIAKP